MANLPSWQTGFKVGSVDVRFGIAWSDGETGMADWQAESLVADLRGDGMFVTQLLGVGARRVTYHIEVDTVADLQALDGLIQQTGTLTQVDGLQSVAVSGVDQPYLLGRVYARITTATLLSLTNRMISLGGFAQADATFQADALS